MKRRGGSARRGPAAVLACAMALAACDGASDDGGAAGGDVAAGAEDTGAGAGDVVSADGTARGTDVAQDAVGADAAAGGDAGGPDGNGADATGAGGDVDAMGADGSGGADGTGGSADAGACGEGCAEGEACAGGFCVADCGDGFDAEAAVAALGAGLMPATNACGDIHALVALAGAPGESVLGLSAMDEAGKARFDVVRIGDLGSGTIAPTAITSATADGSLDAFEIFPGGYLGTDSAATKAVFGWSAMGDGFPGTIAAAATAPGSVATTIDAPGNYAAAVLEDGRLLVNGLGAAGTADGQGLYLITNDGAAPTAVRIVTGLGSASGDVAVDGDVVLVGGFEGFGTTWPDGAEGNRVFAFALTALLDAAGSGAPLDAQGDGQVVDIPGDFAFAPEGRILAKRYDESYMIAGFDLIPWTAADDGLSLGEPIPVTTGAFYRMAAPLPGTSLWVLAHDHGLLLAELPGGR